MRLTLLIHVARRRGFSLHDARRCRLTVGQDGMWEQVAPKASTSDERYGFMVKSECTDGAAAVTKRNMSKIIGCKHVHLHKVVRFGWRRRRDLDRVRC